MMTDLKLEPYDLRTVPDGLAALLTDLFNVIDAERVPTDPPKTLETNLNDWRNLPEHITVTGYAILNPDGTAVVAAGDVATWQAKENQHLAEMHISVHPASRREGLASLLLEKLVPLARAAGRTSVIGSTMATVPSGAEFMKAIGAKPGLVAHLNQMDLNDLDRPLLEGWIARAPERAADYELVYQFGPYPEDWLEPMRHVKMIMNTAPRGELDVEDEEVTMDQMLAWEAHLKARGGDRWTIVARHKPTGDWVGFTELVWFKDKPNIIQQWGTGVHPAHRDRGLGRWLKAANLLRVLDEKPGLRYVRTGNADSNKPMLGINYTMGFKPFIAATDWQVGLDTLEAYLKARN
ncbi:MAG TPA: GNAT family N-acetyltransferase [Deinococcales bacterium]|nr:GNAT family N-acetyltransferase [Deinococcales bacterium]